MDYDLQKVSAFLAKAKAQTDPLLTRTEAARYLSIAPHTLAVWASGGRMKIPVVKIGRTVRYKKSDLDAFVSNGRSS